ncbi:endonuclease [Janibacter cremeus]|uniref:endonuclease n=1 Tax=Janibacter cremeus TaxID=1285192 RepID=UPI0023F6C5E7|nr:endonuclease [Janibacter cremeus]WEV77163.1 endonuclease [Janibacter cremeus]
MSDKDTVERLLRDHGTTYSEEAGIRLRDTPAPLFQLLCLTQLFSAPIGASVAVATMRELLGAGWTTPEHLLDSTWQERADALGRGGYRRYDESTATYLAEMAQLLQERWRGDLRRLHEAANDEGSLRSLLEEFPRVGPTGSGIFCREVQAVWPDLRPQVDDRVRQGAGALGLPTDPEKLAALVDGDDLARLTAALVRVDLDD